MLLLYSLIILYLQQGVRAPEVSPCPRLFIYERHSPEPDRWYAIVTLLSETDLNGVWLRILFDRPILQLGNWFGEVELKNDHTDFLVKNPSFTLKARTPKIIRIYAKYNTEFPIPKIKGFRLNARTVCPEDVVTTTPSTTTEHLFTSFEMAGGESDNVAPQLPPPPATEFSAINSLQQATTTSKAVSEIDTALNNTSVEEICGTVADIHRQGKHIGQVARKGEFPWHVTLYYTKGIVIAYLCGASLISRNHILTVAHCVYKTQSQIPIDSERLVVYLGKQYVKHWQHDATQIRYVHTIISHPEYNWQTYNNDIAIIKLLSAVDFTNNVRPVCLWRESTEIDTIANRAGTVVGWGFDENGKIEDKLMHVQMIAQNPEICNSSLTNYFSRFSSLKSYCANFVDDTVECVGDSGGGMVYPKLGGNITSSVWQLRGLVTVSVVLQHHLKCDRSHYVVFTDVAKYLDWITENMQ